MRLVRGNDGQNKVMGPPPILFAGVGPCAEKTLAAFAEIAAGLTVSVQGPFGLALVDAFGEAMVACDWLWLSDFRVPESVSSHERSELVGQDPGKLQASLSSLVRRLRSVEPSVDPATPGRNRMNCYVLIDLSTAGTVASAVKVMQVLRHADPAQDMTVLGLTARAAVTDSTYDKEWFEAWKQLLAGLQREALAQRVFLLDGCDADKTWFERPEQLHRLGAEFLLYHGLTCRGLLRQNERARTGPGESLLNVCGSFGRRIIQVDLPAVAERVAERLAREELADFYTRTVPSRWLESIDGQAQTLVNQISDICEKARRARSVLSGGRPDRSAGYLAASAEMSGAMAQTIKDVCSREPLLSLCHFFQCLGPKLGSLLSRQQLGERARTRQLVAEVFHRQIANTYEPMWAWLSDPRTQWVDRFTPKQKDPPQVAVSRPADIKSYVAGYALLAVGLVAVAAGLLWQNRFLVIGGGLLSIASSALMALPTGWTRHRRRQIRDGQEVAQSVAPVPYRKRARRSVLGAAGALIVVGVAGVTGPLWSQAWTHITVFWAGVLAVIAGIGAALVVSCPTESHPFQVSTEEASGHANPPIGRCRATGLSCFALAWTILWLWAPSPAVGTTVEWIIHVAGLLLVAVGMGVALFPRAGRVHLVDRVPRIPQPIAGGIGCQTEENELSRKIGEIATWIDRLTLDPAQCLQWSKATDTRRDREMLFDFLAADWDAQLAEAVRRELKARSDKTLRTLALQPVLWTECITKELQDPHARCPELTSLFALQAVKAWIQSHTLAELLSFLNVDMARFGRLTGRLAPPHWPATRVEPDVSASVVVIGKPLWDVLGPLAQTSGAPPIVPLDWDSNASVILVLRLVQGLSQGWRGFPGMPGQSHDQHQSTPSPAGSGTSGESHAEASAQG